MANRMTRWFRALKGDKAYSVSVVANVATAEVIDIRDIASATIYLPTTAAADIILLTYYGAPDPTGDNSP